MCFANRLQSLQTGSRKCKEIVFPEYNFVGVKRDMSFKECQFLPSSPVVPGPSVWEDRGQNDCHDDSAACPGRVT